MSDLDYVEPARIIGWIFERRARVPEYADKPDSLVLQHIINLIQTAKLHLAYDGDAIVGVVIYKREPKYLYLHLILTEPPLTLHDLTAAWLYHYPGVSILGWRKKCKKEVLYTQEQVKRALRIMVPNVHPLELCKN